MADKRRKGEKELIAGIRARAQARGIKSRLLTLGIGDDCAVIQPRRGEELLVTTDLSLEKIHFRRDWHPPESIGHRCLARGLSDLAAMGARPEAALVSLAVPPELRGRWMERFFDGLLALALRYSVPLAGGDLAQSPPGNRDARRGLVAADIVLLGSAPAGRALFRSSAQPGDGIYVTGALGGAAAELRVLRHDARALRKLRIATQGHPHMYPEPRLAAGRKLMESHLANAAIDLSDGLSTDLAHLCEESGLAAELDVEAIPVDARATLQDALHGGEDYELLFTAGSGADLPAVLGGVSVHAIGRMKKRIRGPRIEMRHKNGRRTTLEARGWEHFRRA